MTSDLPADHVGMSTRACKTCGEIKPPSEFPLYKHKACYGGYQAHTSCKACERTRKAESHLLNKYGLTQDDYNKMSEDQGGVCYLCGDPPSDMWGKLVVDHDHSTGEVRALLCRTCNVFLSRLEKCPDYLACVVEYLS